MNFKIIEDNGETIAVIEESESTIIDAQAALDLMTTVRYESKCDSVILPKSAFAEDFFKLSTGMAGEILQKFVNYRFRIAIVGNFSGYTSKPLHDFIYECNNGAHIYFVATEDEALRKLCQTNNDI